MELDVEMISQIGSFVKGSAALERYTYILLCIGFKLYFSLQIYR